MVRLDDGYQTLITFADGALEVYEKEVQPPGIQGGGEIDTTTHNNATWRTKSPKSLKQMDPTSHTVAFDTAIYASIVAQINSNQLITVTLPNGATIAFWGWIDEFTPNAFVEGEQPTAEMTIIPSLVNDSGVETAPVYTAPGP